MLLIGIAFIIFASLIQWASWYSPLSKVTIGPNVKTPKFKETKKHPYIHLGCFYALAALQG